MDTKMGRWRRGSIWLALALALAGGGVVACKASGSATGESAIGPYKVKFRVSSNGSSYEAEGPAGVCLEIEWRDSQGASLGKSTVALPASGQVPSGSVSWSAQEIDCPEPEQSLDGAAADIPQGFEVFGAPVFPDLVDGGPYKNAAYRFEITGRADVNALAIVEPILRAGPGAVVPAGVNVISFTQVIPENDGFRLIAADTEPFQGFQMDWNGNAAYATLGSNALLSSVGSWTTLEIRVTASAINGLSVANQAEIQRSTASQPTPVVERASWTWLP